jgi:hypothetical protein
MQISSRLMIVAMLPTFLRKQRFLSPDVLRTEKRAMYVGDNGENLGEAVIGNSVAALISDGIFGVWKYSNEYANAAATLVNHPAEIKGWGLEATPLKELFGIDRSDDNETKLLITRPESRGVVASCLNFKDTSAIVGSPGIGKSWQLLFALQQALLYDGANVMLHVPKRSCSYGVEMQLMLGSNKYKTMKQSKGLYLSALIFSFSTTLRKFQVRILFV